MSGLRVWLEPPHSPAEKASICGFYLFCDKLMGSGSSKHPSLPVAWVFDEAWDFALEKGISAIWINDPEQLFKFEPWVQAFSP